jgi:UDP-N-acetylmuramate dehydrogenase
VALFFMADPIQDHDITYLTTMKTRVVAAWYAEAENEQDLIDAVLFAQKKHLPYVILGGGSNTVIVTPRLEAVVIKNRSQLLEVVTETDAYVDVRVSSGYAMPRLVKTCIERGWEGLEYHKGLPGTVGGAVYMNSKWTNPLCYVGDVVHTARLLMENGDLKTVDRAYFDFAYDYSVLHKTHEILLDVVFRLGKTDSAVLEQRAAQALAHRDQTQPKSTHTCGCMFQNITPEQAAQIGVTTQSAGNLIDLSGMKGKQRGSFVVSTQHANFIIDEQGSGNPADLLQLIQDVKNAVRTKFGIDLKEEVAVIH